MNAEEKAAFAALEASDEEFEKYEELEDDFLFIANEGQVALELAEEEVVDPKTGEKKLQAAEAGKAFDAAEADHRNREIEIVSDESENEEE